jgi:hypothetical protein
MAADLITLQQLLDFENKILSDLEAQEVRKYEDAIHAASAAVRSYTDRDFTLNASGVATARNFEYDDSGYIDIDDAQSVTLVRVLLPYNAPSMTLTTNQFQALPFDGPVKDNIILYYPDFSYGMSREMGFTWNLDTYDGPMGDPPPIVEVTAVWGWAEIPDDVQMATIWIASAFSEDDRSITSENIDSFGRSYSTAPPSAIPLRARDLLDQYRRIVV